MKSVLLIGLGKFGTLIAQELTNLNHQVLAVDSNEDRVSSILPIVTTAVIGDSTSEEFLESIGIGNFDSCIIAIGDNFQSSLETTALLKELGAKKVVARACNDVHEKFLLRNGADEVIYPEKQLARWTAMKSISDSIQDYIELDETCSIFEVEIPQSWQGKSIISLDVRRKYNLNILGIRENGKMNMNITPDSIFQEGQTVLVLGHLKNIQRCFHI